MTDLKNIRIDGKRLWDSIMSMAEIGPGAEGGSCRLALTDVDRAGLVLIMIGCR
jgi:N-carbamoyl-L-amino-acid hydrolase